MSTAELMEKIKALPPEKQKEVESFVDALQDNDPIRYLGAEEGDAIAERVFRENAELFRKLAQ